MSDGFENKNSILAAMQDLECALAENGFGRRVFMGDIKRPEPLRTQCIPMIKGPDEVWHADLDAL